VTGWRKWGDTSDEPVEHEEPPTGVLSTDRYCPRCDRETLWTNEQTGGVLLFCSGCGINVASKLEPHELDRVAAYDERPIRQRRRAYQVV
jgi:transcription elongation factor Elf1